MTSRRFILKSLPFLGAVVATPAIASEPSAESRAITAAADLRRALIDMGFTNYMEMMIQANGVSKVVDFRSGGDVDREFALGES